MTSTTSGVTGLRTWFCRRWSSCNCPSNGRFAAARTAGSMSASGRPASDGARWPRTEVVHRADGQAGEVGYVSHPRPCSSTARRLWPAKTSRSTAPPGCRPKAASRNASTGFEPVKLGSQPPNFSSEAVTLNRASRPIITFRSHTGERHEAKFSSPLLVRRLAFFHCRRKCGRSLRRLAACGRRRADANHCSRRR